MSTADALLDRARQQGEIGEQAFRRGDHAASAQALEEGLQLLGRKVPRLPLAAVLIELARRAVPRRVEASEADRVSAHLHGLLTFPYYFQRGLLFTLWTHLRELAIAEQLGDSSALSRAYANHALAVAQLPWTSRTLDFAGRAVEVAERIGDPAALARARHVQALVLFWSCRYREGLEKGREAMDELSRLGDAAEANAARFVVASCLYRLGRLRESAELVREQHRIALETGGAVAVAGAVDLWAKASGGDIPAAAIEDARRRCGDADPVLGALLHGADGLRLLHEGRLSEAIAAFSQGDERLRAARFRNGLAADAPAHLAGALRLELQTLPPLALDQRRMCLARARKAARRALRIARKFEKALPHALREAGLIEAAAGRPRAAARLFRECLAVAGRQGAEAESLRARIALAELQGDRAAASAAIDRLRLLGGEPAPFAIAQGPALLRAGRAIAAALSTEAITEAARQAAVEVLRAASCTVEGPQSQAGAPIVARGVTVARLVAQPGAGGAFGDDDRQLLGFIAALAGAALENNESFVRAQAAEREVRLLNQRAASASEEERRRLALALHDGAGQTLSAAALHLASVKDEAAGRVRSLIEATLDDLRGLARDLRPAALDRLGLVPALEGLASSSTTPALSVTLQAAKDLPELPADAALALYRIAQSALSNVQRHSGAGRAEIVISLESGRFRLSIADDGAGFDPAHLSPQAGIGLAGMRERAAWIGATLEIESAPGRGTRVTVYVPAAAAVALGKGGSNKPDRPQQPGG